MSQEKHLSLLNLVGQMHDVVIGLHDAARMSTDKAVANRLRLIAHDMSGLVNCLRNLLASNDAATWSG